MGQYCDSKVLEHNWYLWLLANNVPALEPYRQSKLLWTRIAGHAKKSKHLPDATHPEREHCLALPNPIFFRSESGVVDTELPSASDLTLESDHPSLKFDDPFVVMDSVIPDLQAQGFIHEAPTITVWHAMLHDIDNMCQGIATKFNPPSKEDHLELSNEALLQVTRKLTTGRLVYTPGKAPVFNLLTTTIFRCMYSIQNRKKHQREGMLKLATDMQAGTLPDNYRSFRIGMAHRLPNSHAAAIRAQ